MRRIEITRKWDKETLPHWAGEKRHGDMLSTRGGRLYIEGCDVPELVDRFGSPLFVFSEAQVLSNLDRYRKAFRTEWRDGPVEILAAFKANTLLAIRHLLTEAGAGADVYSPEELGAVLSSGIDPQRVSVSGGGKGRDHLRSCVAAGVRITVEDPDEPDLIQEVAAEVGKIAKIRFRVRPTVPNLWRKTDFTQLSVPIDLGMQVYKAGVPTEYLVEMGRRVFAMPNVELVGLHLHAGRHHASRWYWEGLMKRYAALIADLSEAWDGWVPREIDVGGGMASPRDPINQEFPRSEFVATTFTYPLIAALRASGERVYHSIVGKMIAVLTKRRIRRAPPSIEEYGRTVAGTLRRELNRRGIDTAGVLLQVEPGRGLYGDTGIHLARVKKVKRQTRPFPYSWVLLDTTNFFFGTAVMDHSRFPFVVASNPNAPATMTADLVGHSCGPDMIAPGAALPEVGTGDVVAFLETGAYHEVSAANFNGLPRPASVLVNGSTAELIKRAETASDVFARDTIPNRLRRSQPDIVIDLTEQPARSTLPDATKGS